jgi:rare lipoprotein A
MAVLALLPVLAVHATAAPGIPQLASQLAADAGRLGEARTELHEVQADLRDVRREHRLLRREVEGRLVAIYKLGGRSGALERVVGGESMQDVGATMTVLDQVAEHDAALLVRWKRLDDRLGKLTRRAGNLTREVDRLETVVQKSRERLSAAEAAAARARREAERMALIADSPLLPKVGHPETTAVQASGGGGVSVNQPIGFTQSGTASVYHDSFTGQTTANGETYDPNAFTAAHPSLPFGTWVTVSGANGSIQVRINDRGPFVGGRIIDLSGAAASAIGLSLGSVTLSVAS